MWSRAARRALLVVLATYQLRLRGDCRSALNPTCVLPRLLILRTQDSEMLNELCRNKNKFVIVCHLNINFQQYKIIKDGYLV